MELKDICTNLELSKELRELGVPQKSFADWCEIDDNEWILLVRKQKEFNEIKRKYGEMEGCISAFTSAELGEMLGKCYKKDFMNAYLEAMDLEVMDYPMMAHNLLTQPDIPALMLIYLLKNKLITL